MRLLAQLAATCTAAAVVALTESAAFAAPVVGLVGDDKLVMFDTDKPQVTRTWTIGGHGRLLGIDVRPADNKLYAVAADGTVLTIDTASGAKAVVVKLDKTLPTGVTASVDFNPVADRLRIMGSDGTNLRADLATGKVVADGGHKFEPTDPNAQARPMIVATAYTNSKGKPEKTQMFDIDAGLGALIQQVAPNDGVLKTIGKLGTGNAKTFALDIQAMEGGKNTAWLAADNKLYKISLDTGAAMAAGEVKGAPGMLRDIAILPAK
jgi:DNA-binding beta-propeller fold protein YncE